MLRPLLAFLTLCFAAFLLAPTVASVHEKVTELHFDRKTPWEIWKWTDEPSPMFPFPDCSKKQRQLYSEITQWPAKVRKDEAFTLRGIVASEEDGRLGVSHIDVDIFLNKTKTAPGIFLGKTRSGDGGFFTLVSSVPFELVASHYHIVAHAKEAQIDCSFYLGHWSDPETDVVSETRIEWGLVDHPVAGREFDITGRLVDAVGAPVSNASLTLDLGAPTRTVRTDRDGVFRLNYTPARAGNLTISAHYRGSAYYEASRNQTTVEVAREFFALAQTEDPIVLLRSQPRTISGQVYVADNVRQGEIVLAFSGTRVATCATCPLHTMLAVPLGTDGSFSVEVMVPPSEPGASATLVASGGGLQGVYRSNLSVEIPTTLTLEARGTGLFSKGYEANATLRDETGKPLAAPIRFFGPQGWGSSNADANGTARFAGDASCGRHVVQATYNGSEHVRPANAQTETLVCGWLAFMPSWLLAIPWWIWPLAALVAFASWRIARGLRQVYAPAISSGPPLLLSFTEPADDAAGYAAVGEAVTATAFLESPLPDGHTLRMGTPHAMSEQPLDAELRAHLRFVPDKLGTIAIRAEIADARGRIVTRRTIPLHVVRFAEEIERRYLARRAAAGAKENVTPREFETWLRERAPGLDAQIARRLVHVFEEADYSPRAAGRAEFSAYLGAERGIEEVIRDVTTR